MIALSWLLLATAGAGISLVLREIVIATSGRLAPWLVNRAADRYPGSRAEIRREEWLDLIAERQRRNMPMGAVLFGIGTVLGASQLVLRASAFRWLSALQQSVLSRFVQRVGSKRYAVLMLIQTSVYFLSTAAGVGWFLSGVIGLSSATVATIISTVASLYRDGLIGPKRR